jgi:predicted membrane protein
LPLKLIFFQVYGTRREDLNLFVIDNCLITFSLGFLIFASSVLYQTLKNIRNYSSEPQKLKGIKLNKVRSIEEMKDHIFGKQATLSQIILPFY